MTRTNPRARRLLCGVAVGCLALAVLARPLGAQPSSSRFRVLVASLSSSNEKQGQKIAEAVRGAIDTMHTHVSIPDKDVKAALKKLNIKETALSCLSYRQLMKHVDAQLVMCGEIGADGQVTAQFFNPDGGSYDVPPFAFTSDEDAARQIANGFQQYVQMLRLLTYCDTYLRSMQWEPALESCDQALAMNPKNTQALYGRGSALANLDRQKEALAAFQQVIELDPIDEAALRHAAFTASKLERADLARQYLNLILELNPGDTQVRLNLAADMANEGDPVSALALVEGVDTANVTLREYAGHFAMRAAGDLVARNQDGTEMFRKAIGHYEYVVAVKADTTALIVLRNLMVAHNGLSQATQALAWGARATAHPDADAATWSAYADALRGANRLTESLTALERVQQLDATYAVTARRAFIYLDLGRINDAVAAIRQAAASNELSTAQQDQLAQKIIATGFENFQKARKFDQAFAIYDAARSVAPGDNVRAMANFFHGFGLYEAARAIQDEGTVTSAKTSLPMFQRAKTMLEASASYTSGNASLTKTRTDVLGAIQTLIEIQEAIIKRG